MHHKQNYSLCFSLQVAVLCLNLVLHLKNYTRMRFVFLFSILICCLFFSCKTNKILTAAPLEEYEDLDTLVISAAKPNKLKTVDEFKLPDYNPSQKRNFDLIHTKLDLRFDWAKQHVLGVASLQLNPYFYAKDVLNLDAKNFDIHKVQLDNGKTLQYDYDGQVLRIALDRKYQAKEQLNITIDYTAKPADRDAMGGSQAITSDQGLFFINHDGADSNKPKQIWTQGETENNSRWFPTIDKPNERCTQEVYLTVEDKFKTLSNGLLLSSKKNANGTRTDYWKMDQAHAPYLFMLAVGEYAIIKDKWRDIELLYYVEPEYAPYAKNIFSNTKEMLDFFSLKLGIDYPWQKYAQVVVRDFVSGAMENTTAVIFGEFVQLTERELIDNHNERIIAHELFHHWFGDLVTCENWANLTMNEGFANYSEYLWLAHKYGNDEGDHHLFGELQGYLNSVKQGGMHPLIYYGYKDKEEMFDAHSYNKGGLVLHMLRNYLGDEAFFAGLKRYLKIHEYTDVEVHELRLAFEDVSGEDLNWFFNQWYLSAGHPELDINYTYDEATKKIHVDIEQTQDTDKSIAIFELPFVIDLYIGKEKAIRENVRMTKRKQRFSFDAPIAPSLVNVDAEKILLCEKKDNKSEEAYIFQYYNTPNFIDRYEAINALKNSKNPKAKAVFRAALKDPFWVIRGLAIEKIEPTPDSGAQIESADIDLVSEIAANDPHSEVKASALNILGASGEKRFLPILKKAITEAKAYPVISAALEGMSFLNPSEALVYAKNLEKEENGTILSSIGNIYAGTQDLNYLPFFEDNWSRVDGYDAIYFFENYLGIVQAADQSIVKESMDKLKDVALNMGQSPWRRLSATRAMSGMVQLYQQRLDQTSEEDTKRATYSEAITDIRASIDEIKRKESNPRIKNIYEQF